MDNALRMTALPQDALYAMDMPGFLMIFAIWQGCLVITWFLIRTKLLGITHTMQ